MAVLHMDRRYYPGILDPIVSQGWQFAAIMFRVVSDIAYRRWKLTLQYYMKLKASLMMMNAFNNQTYFSNLTQKRKHWHGLDYAVNLYCQ